MTILVKPKSPDAKGVETWREVRFEVLEKIEDLPSFSSVVVEFMALCQQEFFSARDFEEIIGKDQALVARLLKVANSGLYGRARSIKSIPQAVVLIGLDNLQKIVFAVSSQGLMCTKLQKYAFHLDNGFWIHSMGVGQAAQIINQACKGVATRPEESFICGLMHDLGKLVLDNFLGSTQTEPISLEEERTTVGLDHCELAELILKQWNIPESITGPVRHHHDFRNAGQWLESTAILSMARGICSEWKIGFENPMDLSKNISPDLFSDERKILGLTSKQYEDVIWNIQQGLGGLEEIYKSV